MKRKVAVYIRFNDNDANLANRFKIECLSREWINERMKIFNQYTRISLESQSNQDFLAVLRIHPDTTNLVDEALSQYPSLNDNIIFTPSPKAMISKYTQNTEELYLAHIDSDDMYHPDFIQTLYDSNPRKETAVLICQKGYILEHHTRSLAHYFNKSPSLFTQIFKEEDYTEVYQHFPELSHVIMHTLPYESIGENMFIIVAHDFNTYTKANPYYHLIDDKEKDIILKKFGLYQSL